ncbi:MAG: homocysteine S-methyltransferase family protein [Chloroflexi bacterium]|nr:MAG: homocysteine S-methyltransferase family protein [Chloroflexota bacterium]
MAAGVAPQMTIQQRLAQPEPVILDGAVGTELQRRGIQTTMPLWSAHGLLEAPELVQAIHEEYIRAGAEIITTNTFRTGIRTMTAGGIGDRARELTHLAVRLAQAARANAATRPVWIAGSIAPVEDCYSPELVPDEATCRAEHGLLATWLAEAGCDLLLVETMNTVREARAALEAANATGLPSMCSFVTGHDGNLLSGETLEEAVAALAPLGPIAFLINCVPPEYIERPFRELARVSPVPVGLYSHLGEPGAILGWEFHGEISPQHYGQHGHNWRAWGAKIIGGCCGTTPEHVAALTPLPPSPVATGEGGAPWA